mgnify:CR=1 FL=1
MNRVSTYSLTHLRALQTVLLDKWGIEATLYEIEKYYTKYCGGRWLDPFDSYMTIKDGEAVATTRGDAFCEHLCENFFDYEED